MAGAGLAPGLAAAEPESKIVPENPVHIYPDLRPSPELRLDGVTDQGVILQHGDGPGQCDASGAREAIVYQDGPGHYYLHYDGGGPRGWLACLATSSDLTHWEKKGPVLDFGKSGASDSASASSPWVIKDGPTWHMFYLATEKTAGPPYFIPACPYLTMHATSSSPAGPWTKKPGVLMPPQPGHDFYHTNIAPGAVVKHAGEYLMFCSTWNSLGIARSSDLDGKWTMDREPIFGAEHVENSALYYQASDQTWFLFTNHIGIAAGTEYTDAIWVYWTKDINHWDAGCKAVAFDGKNCGWSKTTIGLPSVLPVGNRLALLYDGKTGEPGHDHRDLGLAWIHLPIETPAPDRPIERLSVDQPALRQDFARINDLMRLRGINTDPTSGLSYFTGYSYHFLYDWDPYFEGIVELSLGWTPHYLENGVKIFLGLQRENGFIRRVNDTRSHEGEEMIKPFLAQISVLVARRTGTLDWLDAENYQRLRRYLAYWLETLKKDNTGLSYWRSAPHTGMDTQTERAGAWEADFCDGADLNSYLYRECLAFALIADAKGHADDATHFRLEAEKKKTAIQKYCWNEADGFYYDLDNRTGKQIKVKSAAGFAPMWAQIPTPQQAKRLLTEHLMNRAEFWRDFPVAVLAATEKGYSENYETGDIEGSNWRANTWIPTNYYIFHALRAYGYEDLAKTLADMTLQKVRQIGEREYYTSDSGKGCGLNPFWGWSLLAYFMPLENQHVLDPTDLDLNKPLLAAF